MLRRSTAAAVAIVLLLLATSCGADPGTTAGDTTTTAATVAIGAGLTGPSGLVATVAATGLEHVAALTTDASGRVWASTAAAADDGTDAVFLLPADGSAPVAAITGLHTPLGLQWVDDTLLVASKDVVEAYSGFDGSAFAEHHVALTLPDGVGESNGMARSADGRIVLGISAPCDHCTPTSPYSASIVSFLPDGSDLQVVARGIRAPVGLTYAPGTDDLYVTMNQRDDLGDATPGDWLALVHAGDDWGFPDCYGQGGDACTGVPSPVATLDPHAAVSGVAFTQGPLAESFGSSAVVAEWATGAVLRVELAADGASGTVSTFLTGFTNPVPVLSTSDGSLLIGDWTTGTVYQITAATSSTT